MIFVFTNRSRSNGSFGGRVAANGKITYLSEETGELKALASATFRRQLLDALSSSKGDEPARIIGMIHGYNTSWERSLEVFRRVDENITRRLDGPGVTVGFSWPSQGEITHYLDDRQEARASAEALSTVVVEAIRVLETAACPAELCLIAHSMGNYVLGRAAEFAHEHRGRPTVHNVFSEVLMVAPDVDAAALEPGGVTASVPIFARRVTVYRSRVDRALVTSTVKRAGTTGARLGRQGPAHPDRVPSNVVTVDATPFTRDQETAAHGAYFVNPRILDDIAAVLHGDDRSAIPGREEDGLNSFSLTPLDSPR